MDLSWAVNRKPAPSREKITRAQEAGHSRHVPPENSTYRRLTVADATTARLRRPLGSLHHGHRGQRTRGTRAGDRPAACCAVHGLAIGFTVFVGAAAVGGISGGAFNPAVAPTPSNAGVWDLPERVLALTRSAQFADRQA
jgi:hypothetical protein